MPNWSDFDRWSFLYTAPLRSAKHWCFRGAHHHNIIIYSTFLLYVWPPKKVNDVGAIILVILVTFLTFICANIKKNINVKLSNLNHEMYYWKKKM